MTKPKTHSRGAGGHGHGATETAEPVAFEAPDAKASLAWLTPQLARVTAARWFQVDIEAACVAALGVCARCAAPDLRTRFEALAKIGEFEIESLDDLPRLAVGVRQLRIAVDQAEAQAAGGKLDAALVAEAHEVEARMQSACEHTLSKIPEAQRELDRLAPGSGYRDDASDLEGYAELYDSYPERVALDGVNYRSGDAARGRALAKQILAALALAETSNVKKARADLGRGATLLLDAYEAVAWAGAFLSGPTGDPKAFPSLVAAGRKPRRRKKPDAPPPPEPTPPPPEPPVDA
jgi:hypothetical protein